MKIAWIMAGWLFFGIGVIGVVLPGLPTTPPMLLALACFARGSNRLRAWLLDHRVFGPSLRRWQRYGTISVRAKTTAVTLMLASFACVWALSPLPRWGGLSIGALIVVGIGVVLRIPHTFHE